MLSLDSDRWSELTHAYGTASDIPALLAKLKELPGGSGENEPWYSLWSALAHQGDVYPASFAAVPHVIAALASAPLRADASYFQFPAWVEICRRKGQVTIPVDIEAAYFESLAQLPKLAALASAREWDDGLLRSVLSAIAVVKGQASIAEAVLELSPEIAEEFMAWVSDR